MPLLHEMLTTHLFSGLGNKEFSHSFSETYFYTFFSAPNFVLLFQLKELRKSNELESTQPIFFFFVTRSDPRTEVFNVPLKAVAKREIGISLKHSKSPQRDF